jgi:hypothetical protein
MNSETVSCNRGATGQESGGSIEAIQALLFARPPSSRETGLFEVFMGLAAIEEDPGDASSVIDLAILERRSPHRSAAH